jgi:hypothetical protein
MSIIFTGKISPENILDGVDEDRYFGRFRIHIRNSEISVEYSDEGNKEEIEREAEELVKNLVNDIAFESDQRLSFNSFNGVRQEHPRRKEIELRESGKLVDEVSIVEKRSRIGMSIRAKVDVEKILSAESTKRSDDILNEAKSHYVKSLNDSLDYESRGAHLYKSFEEIKKIRNHLNVGNNLIDEISGLLQKARHIENDKKRIPGEFTVSDYNDCKNAVKELIKRYGDYLKGKDINNYKYLNKSDFFK